MQESMAAQSTVQGYHEKIKAAKEEEDRQKQMVLYHQKLQEIEKLKKIKEEQMVRMGQAHAEAEDAERRRLQAEVEKKDKMIRDAQMRRARGQEAFAKERQLEDEKKKLEEQILCIERKKQVQAQESSYAHSKVQKYREEKEQTEMIEKRIASLKRDQATYGGAAIA